jgi:hypothetical protein
MQRLSDAIMLGSTLKKHGRRGMLFDDDGGACAVGMAYTAIGMTREIYFATPPEYVTKFIRNQGWFWCFDKTAMLPSWALKWTPGEVEDYRVSDIITYLYDHYVSTDKATLEMLVDWVRSVEDELGVYANGSSEGLDDKVPSDSPKLDCLPEEGAVTLGTAGNCVVNTAPALVTLVT